MKIHFTSKLFFTILCVTAIIYGCSKSAPANNSNNNNSNPGGTNTGNNNPQNTSDTFSILGTWLLDTMIVENIKKTGGANYNDTAYPIHPDTALFTSDSCRRDSWMSIFADPQGTVSITQINHFIFTGHYVKQNTELLFYEDGGIDTAYILKLTDHEFSFRMPTPARYPSTPYGGFVEHFRK